MNDQDKMLRQLQDKVLGLLIDQFDREERTSEREARFYEAVMLHMNWGMLFDKLRERELSPWWEEILSNRERWRWWSSYYRQSDAWKNKRSAVFERSHGYCEDCAFNPAELVHHLTYKRYGNELLSDLKALCGDRHTKVHGQRNAGRKN